ncbi:MAG: HepT-like ribonuclease domain-containing protein [Janthinobacterium lividum]
MNDSTRACLYDVQQAIAEIESFFEGQPMLFAAYRADVRTRRATERNLEIIGEAVGRIMKADPEFQLSNARQIIATRHRIIHGYDTVSDEMVWSIVVRHLPLLKQEVAGWLSE